MFYRQMGKIPHKRHTTFKKPDGTLFREQVMGTKGFSGTQSILYHHYMPTEVARTELIGKYVPEYEDQESLKHRHLFTDQIEKKGDALSAREYLLGNDDLLIGTMNITEPMKSYYRNGDGDEMLYIHYGTGKVETMFGTLTFRPGDYVIIPIGTIYRVIPDKEQLTKVLLVESFSQITTPRRYRNEYGQLLEHSPFCERDIRGPEILETYDQKGEYEVITKTRGYLHSHILNHHPLDVEGWDGYLYPWVFNIEDFEPITGRVHQPPPVHQTFEGHNFVVCSFVPRLYDYHPEAIPAPYYHSNVNSDELLYYVEGNFMSRKGIREGSITLHPSGIPHGPHPGKTEASIGKKETLELAVMIDTFKPLKLVKNAKLIEDEKYMFTWVE
ncbi:homogentisate 1,2-dioxygenase [Cytobacillus firmus]|uniref:homogentisate 1,2-dioxygenase n=1 Tax=Cytobacillus firmus TaxID=1399 RepID=UPI00158113C6|nr:homogentisate 1,2-dioxygenase [Cytobacillus firmus]MBG9550488.1 homogentisate 1,2-dioxygenase [Cytobacillus firmus]MBG9602449.1 homogentisate 1,2-dioxygenase [Cytobacillus firmus]MBG9657402.1 homogentisate 1,2-dioxygenase [Cytobacillus firmus]MED1905220.1 homogentisate 1,2-dioxygenase [Cytobacillus firmus]MED1939925.1 homogentisate 1,2-dioxygenase [Cytobacillus firmus]